MGIIIFPIRPRINDLAIIINIPDSHKKFFDFVRFGGGQDITIQLDCTQAVTADIERRIFSTPVKSNDLSLSILVCLNDCFLFIHLIGRNRLSFIHYL